MVRIFKIPGTIPRGLPLIFVLAFLVKLHMRAGPTESFKDVGGASKQLWMRPTNERRQFAAVLPMGVLQHLGPSPAYETFLAQAHAGELILTL